MFDGGSMLVIASTPLEFGLLPCSVMVCPRTCEEGATVCPLEQLEQTAVQVSSLLSLLRIFLH